MRSRRLGGTRCHSIAPRNEPAATDAAVTLDAPPVPKLAAGYAGIEHAPVREAMDEASNHLLLPCCDSSGRRDPIADGLMMPAHPLAKGEQLGAAQGDVLRASGVIGWHQPVGPALGSARSLDLPARHGHGHTASQAITTAAPMTAHSARLMATMTSAPQASGRRVPPCSVESACVRVRVVIPSSLIMYNYE